MISLIPEPSIFFLVSCDCATCDCDRCHASVMHDIISHFLSISKIKKSKSEN